jgi:hypothetical protein
MLDFGLETRWAGGGIRLYPWCKGAMVRQDTYFCAFCLNGGVAGSRNGYNFLSSPIVGHDYSGRKAAA